jgi:hypothetical protein
VNAFLQAGEYWKVRVVTFDLDDTLWPTTGVVLAANSDLSNWLKENYPTMKHESSAVQVFQHQPNCFTTSMPCCVDCFPERAI